MSKYYNQSVAAFQHTDMPFLLKDTYACCCMLRFVADVTFLDVLHYHCEIYPLFNTHAT